MAAGTVYLMYHELQLPDRLLCQSASGYVRYVITQSDFQAELGWLKESNWRGMSVGEALEANWKAPGVALTFDDGCETDLIAAAPLLKDASFNATFYVIAGYLDTPGHLSRAQLRELSDLNLEIGCHSMTHPYLTEVDSKRLRVEVVEAKERLEQLIGKPVAHFSCPGGRWNHRIARMAQEAGYRSVATSRIGSNSATTDPFCLARLTVMRGTTLRDFKRLCNGEGLFLRRTREEILSLAKFLLGNRTYERVRSLLLGPS